MNTIVVPHAYDDYYEVQENHTLVVSTRPAGLLANDVGRNPAVYTNFAPSHGTIGNDGAIFGNGTFTYTPKDGFTGYDTFIYLIRDNNGSVFFSHYATVTIYVY